MNWSSDGTDAELLSELGEYICVTPRLGICPRSSLSVYQPESADFVGAVGVYEIDLAIYETPKGTRAWRRAWKFYSRPFCDLHFSYTSDPCSRVLQGAACAEPGLGINMRLARQSACDDDELNINPPTPCQ